MSNNSGDASPDVKERDPLGRAVKLLNWMVNSPGNAWGVREMAQGLGLPPSSVHRILSLMERNALVVRDPDTGTYSLDLEFLRIAHRATTKNPIPPAAMEHLRALVEDVDETGVIGLYNPARQLMIFHTVIESTKPLRYVVKTDEWVPITAGASGLAILAFLPQDERRQLLSRSLAAFTENTITNPLAMEHELATIRERGYAISHGQRVSGAVAIAAPIFGAGGRPVGDTILTIPDQRFDPSREMDLAGRVIDCSQAITADLGGSPKVAL